MATTIAPGFLYNPKQSQFTLRGEAARRAFNRQHNLGGFLATAQ
jgi:hypothetical protein